MIAVIAAKYANEWLSFLDDWAGWICCFGPMVAMVLWGDLMDAIRDRRKP